MGLYRVADNSRRAVSHSPHARGAVPNLRSSTSPVFSFSPRPWGCTGGKVPWANADTILPTPVGLYRPVTFVIAAAGNSPHARGAVPSSFNERTVVLIFSPRPWGCTQHRPRHRPGHLILPTPVGLYLFRTANKSPASYSPHARGAVPSGGIAFGCINPFSPRPWGCTCRPLDRRRYL